MYLLIWISYVTTVWRCSSFEPLLVRTLFLKQWYWYLGGGVTVPIINQQPCQHDLNSRTVLNRNQNDGGKLRLSCVPVVVFRGAIPWIERASILQYHPWKPQPVQSRHFEKTTCAVHFPKDWPSILLLQNPTKVAWILVEDYWALNFALRGDNRRFSVPQFRLWTHARSRASRDERSCALPCVNVPLDVACKRVLVYQSRTREAYRRHPVRYAHCHLAYKLN